MIQPKAVAHPQKMILFAGDSITKVRRSPCERNNVIVLSKQYNKNTTMTKQLWTLVMVCTLAVSSAWAQDAGKYIEIDEKVRETYLKGRDVVAITDELTYDYEDQEDMVRAIFIWITDNIEYSIKTQEEQKENRRDRRIRADNAEDSLQMAIDLKEDDLALCLRRRGGVEADYAYLFVKMCEVVGIEAGEITGYLRESERRIGREPRRPDHTWNWAQINGKKYLFDLTMASGRIERNDKREYVFVKEFNDLYFMTPPAVMALNHYPENPEYFFMETDMTLEEFADQPFMLDGFKDAKLEDFFPKEGLIPSSADTVVFKFKFKDGEVPNRILLYERRKISEQPFVREGDYYVCRYVMPESRPTEFKVVIKSSKLYEYEALVYRLGLE